MATLVTKYSVGDIVWCASTMHSTKKLPCPDCLGTKQWQAISPGGRGYLFACPRCSAEYQSNRDLSLAVSVHVPLVSRLTVGSVGWDNDPFDAARSGPRYMCNETGVGGGTVYREADLFETEAKANAAAEVKAAETTQRIAENPQYYHGNLKVSDYQLDRAALTAAESNTRRISYDLQYLVDDLVELATETSEGFTDLTPAKLVKLIEDRFPQRLPDDLETDEKTGKVRLTACKC